MAHWELTLTEASSLLQTGALTSEELVIGLLERADEYAYLNAFTTLDHDAILAEARAKDEERRGRQDLPPLHGLPIALKDNIACAGMPMQANTPALTGFKPTADAAVVTALKNAGAIIFGKNSMHEIAFGGTSNNSFGGPVRNAFDATRVPAGSSGGTGASVGARIVPAGIGSDTGGSVRAPASYNGVIGYRPTTGRWPSHGVLPLSHTRDTLGPIARSVADIDLIDRAVSARLPAKKSDIAQLRIGKPTGFYWDNLAEDVRLACEAAVVALAEAGATIVEIDTLPMTLRIRAIAFPIVFYETIPNLAAYLAEWEVGIQVDQLLDSVASPDVAEVAGILRDPENAISEEEYNRAINQIIPEVANDYRSMIKKHALDAVVYPTSPITAPFIGEDKTTDLNGMQVPTFLTVIRNMDIGSVIALPSISMPVGLDRHGLPVGLAFEGLQGEDEALIGLALATEEVLPSLPTPT